MRDLWLQFEYICRGVCALCMWDRVQLHAIACKPTPLQMMLHLHTYNVLQPLIKLSVVFFFFVVISVVVILCIYNYVCMYVHMQELQVYNMTAI